MKNGDFWWFERNALTYLYNEGVFYFGYSYSRGMACDYMTESLFHESRITTGDVVYIGNIYKETK